MIGCLSLQADDPKEAAKGILARAAARGIISGFAALPTTSTQSMGRSRAGSVAKTKTARKSSGKKK
jgi:hypothetical protein